MLTASILVNEILYRQRRDVYSDDNDVTMTIVGSNDTMNGDNGDDGIPMTTTVTEFVPMAVAVKMAMAMSISTTTTTTTTTMTTRDGDDDDATTATIRNSSDEVKRKSRKHIVDSCWVGNLGRYSRTSSHAYVYSLSSVLVLFRHAPIISIAKHGTCSFSASF